MRLPVVSRPRTVRLVSLATVMTAMLLGDAAQTQPTPSSLGAAPAASSGARLRPLGVEPRGGRATAVVVEDGALVHTALLHPVDGSGRVHGDADAHAQTSHVLRSLETALRAAGTGLDRVARLHVYVADASVTPTVDRLLVERFGKAAAPAVTVVQSRMPREGVLVGMDAVAVTAHRPGVAERLVVDGLPARRGNGAHVAVQPRGPFAIVSGRAAPGEFEVAVRDTMEQLRGDLMVAGAGFEHVVQVKAFLGDMTRADALQQIVAASFEGTAPPLVITEWRGASLPVEIELIATAPGATGTEHLTLVEPIASRYSRVARVFGGRPIFVSGLVGSSADPTAQVREIFDELRRVLTEAGSDMRHIAKATYYVSDTGADQEINTVRPSVFDPQRPPAASKISVEGTGRPNQVVVIDAIAVTADR